MFEVYSKKTVIWMFLSSDDPRIPWLYRLLMRPLLARGFLNSIVVMEEFLYSNCQDINFTIVKPPGLTDDPLKGVAF